MTSVCLYFEVHQPIRLNRFSVFNIGNDNSNSSYFNRKLNQEIFEKVAKKCYIPTNNMLFDLINKFDGKFRISFSLTGTFIEYCEQFIPEVIDSFKELFKTGAVVLSLVSLFFSPVLALAQHRYEFTPAISVSETYDDNINLDPTNERDDYITAVTPSIALSILAENTDLTLHYAPSFVFYDENSEDDTTRHLAALTWGQDLTQYIRFNLTDTYYRSEEPIEYAEDVQGVRTNRQKYWRNTGDASLQFLFGAQNTLAFGYGHNYLKNEDPTLNDGKIQTPFATLAYWFNVKNGVDLNYQYTKADFSRDVGVPSDDYDGHTAGMRYIHRLNPQTSGFIGYSLTTRDFDGLTEDYDVHEGSAGLDHAFSPDVSIALAGGYFIRENERSDEETGYTYDASLIKQFQRGSISIGTAGGWAESYLDAERRGFTRYYSGNARLDYQLLERVNWYAGGTYRLDRDATKREWDSWGGNAGISCTFLRYFSLSLDYWYAERDDDVDTEDYKSNRVMLTLTASKLYRW